MLISPIVGKLMVGGIFSTASEFDIAVRRSNQDIDKLVKLARRNEGRIHHICLLQARENERFCMLNKGKNRVDKVKPKSVCSAV